MSSITTHPQDMSPKWLFDDIFKVRSFMMFDRSKPYLDIPHITDVAQDFETPKTLKAAIGANKALAELKAVGRLIPNQSLLFRAVVLHEAKLSSEIENVITTNDALFRAADVTSGAIDPNTKEVLRYQDALWHGVERIRAGRPLSESFFVELVSILKQTDMTVRRHSGTQIANERTGEVIYTPPEGAPLLSQLLNDLTEFLVGEEDIDPLIKMAAAHYQFEAIHPFFDGNGRTGRLINILYLVEQGLLEIPVLFLSGYFLKHRSDYYRQLLEVTESGNWESWICYVLQAVEKTSLQTTNRIRRIRKLVDLACIEAKAKMPRRYSRELIELIFSMPYTRIETLVSAKIAGRQAASDYLRELERIGLLRFVKYGRNALYFNQQLFDALVEDLPPQE